MKCDCCDREATHVLVDYHHSVSKDVEVFCRLHAFQEGREQCPCCGDYPIRIDDEDGEEIVIHPTYPAGALDGEGCCSEHP